MSTLTNTQKVTTVAAAVAPIHVAAALASPA